MSGGLDQTFQILATTNNEAATQLLVDAVDGRDREIQNGALRALVRRRSPAGHSELLQRWSDLSERHKATIADQNSRMSASLRDALLSSDVELAAKGLDAVVRLREYDLISTLITIAEDKSHARAEGAARAVLTLSELLYDEVAAQRESRRRRDPRLTRKYIAASLEESVRRFDQHRRVDLLEAFLLLTGSNNGHLKQVLQNPHAKAYLPIVNLLGQSTRPGIQELLLSFLEEDQPPSAIHGILARRKDVPFLRRLFPRFGPGISRPLRLNARRIESFGWLKDGLSILKALGDEEQRGVVGLIMASGVNRLEACEVIQYLVREGTVNARRDASEALAEFHGADANRLAIECLQDEDVQVRANVVRQLRDRGIPGAMQRVLSLIDSPEDQVAEAACDSLKEFSFDRFLASFDLLDEEVAQSTGNLVRKVDRQAIPQLRIEFKSLSRTRRLRAIAIAVAMDGVPDIESELIEMLSDEDHFIRAEAARALVHAVSPAARQALRTLLVDESPSVQEAAEQTLQRLAEEGIKSRPAVLDLSQTTENLMQFSRESPR